MDALAKRLQSINSDKLDVKLAIVSGSGHAGVNAETYTRGLQFAFERSDVDVKEKILNRYQGQYMSEDGKTNFSIASDLGRLVLVFDEHNRIDLNAESATRFYAPGHGLDLVFHDDQSMIFYNRRVPAELKKIAK